MELLIDYAVDPNFDIQINAPKLQSFKYSRILAKDFVLPKFLTLLDAEIVLACPAGCRERGELGHLATKLFSSLSYVKHLTIFDCSLKRLSYQDHFQKKMPTFHNLIHLEVTSARLYFGLGCRDEGNLPCWVVGILLDFLHISPNLESLIFAEGLCRYASTNSNEWSLSPIPQCLLRSLKSIEFQGVWGKQVEKDLIRLFLKNAKVLQKGRRYSRDLKSIAFSFLLQQQDTHMEFEKRPEKPVLEPSCSRSLPWFVRPTSSWSEFDFLVFCCGL
ncbi:FBD-associated F-box protein At5g22730-like [Papaver somniferum]|uniref:FBD-associated F-box protein At5g22730-like n=1 Tax=Papaver somniferum TaxID=3469 RepID=UPI000E7022A5|nr:FBD-associated F-box protein At5g22730-like [Papaver somniferum]